MPEIMGGPDTPATGARVVRTVAAPSRREADALAAPLVAAFAAAGWYEQERIWVPGDRRVGLGESLLLNPSQELLLEADGELRIAFVNPDPAAIPPAVAAAVRERDVFERIGGTRYRRLVPRMALGCLVTALLFGAFAVLAGPTVSRILDESGKAGGIERVIDGGPRGLLGEGQGVLEVDGQQLICDVATGECR